MKVVKALPKLPERHPTGHKGDYGRVLVIAGSVGMTGAACLCAQAALRAGAGLVRLALPQSLNIVAEIKLTCVISEPMPETAEWTISREARDLLYDLSQEADVVAVGPGLGRNEETDDLVHFLIQTVEKPLVIDADGLNAVAPHPEIFRNAKAPLTLTPHPGEMARLLGLPSAGEVQKNRVQIASEFAQTYQTLVVLKGHHTIVTDGQRAYINATGNPGMATAGSGDVLTGLIAGLIPQFGQPFDAAQLGVFLHGLAGDLAAKELTQYCTTAEDILGRLPEAFKMFRKKTKAAGGSHVQVEEVRVMGQDDTGQTAVGRSEPSLRMFKAPETGPTPGASMADMEGPMRPEGSDEQ